MAELIKRQEAINVVGQLYRYESDRMTALQELAIVTEQEIRNKAIDEFAEKLKDSLAHNYRHLLNVDTDGFEWLTTDAVETHIDEVAEQMKGV